MRRTECTESTESGCSAIPRIGVGGTVGMKQRRLPRHDEPFGRAANAVARRGCHPCADLCDGGCDSWGAARSLHYPCSIRGMTCSKKTAAGTPQSLFPFVHFYNEFEKPEDRGGGSGFF